MKENVRKFEKALRENEELRKQLSEELKKIGGEKKAESYAEAMAMAARALGYDFTVADIEKAGAEAQELDPDEMETAAGGVCAVDYDCYTAWNHDTPNQQGTACFGDYECITVYHDSKAGKHLYEEYVEPVVDYFEFWKDIIKSIGEDL